jgi:hypothetical protein
MTTTTSWWMRAGVALAAAATLALPAAPSGAQTSPARPLTPVVEHVRAGNVNTQGTVGQPMSSPAIGDVTGDGMPNVVVGSLDGTLTVLDLRSGAVLRQVVVQAGSMVQTAPTLVDVTGDGVLDVAVGTVRNRKGVVGSSRVKIYDMTGGGARVVFDQGDSGLANLSGFFGAPAVGDITGNGRPEVVALGLDHRLHAWRLDGSIVPGFPTYTYDTSLSSPALADVTRDGRKEIVFGGDMDADTQPLREGGYLWVVDGHGDPLPGYPLRLGGEVIWSSPAVADINGDGNLNAVVGTGRNFGHPDQRQLYAVDLRTRQMLPGWPRTLTGNTMASPALGQLDADAALEVVMLTGDGNAHRLEHNGRLTWTACTRPQGVACANDPSIPNVASPVIADVDGDGDPEIVVTSEREVVVLDSATGAVEQRLPMPAVRADFAYPASNAPAVGTVGADTYVAAYVQIDNGDRRWDHGDSQGIYVWRAAGAAGGASASAVDPAPWPQFRRDAGRSGTIDPYAPAPAPPPPPSSLTGVHAYIDAVHQDLLGRHSTLRERTEWSRQLREGLPRGEFTLALSRSPEWTGTVVDGLYEQIFGRAPDAGGRAYWSALIAGGLRVSEVASHFYGSEEWFRRPPPTGGGGTIDGFVDNLYARILRRDPDAGRAHWVGEVRAGVPRVTVAKAFYLSYESNVRRVDVLYRTLLGRRADETGRRYWGELLVTVDDIRLAGLLTASDEYYSRHSR